MEKKNTKRISAKDITYKVLRRVEMDSKWLRDIAIYLEGVKAGKGNISPLGDIHLEQLWTAIKYMNHYQS